MAALPLNTVLRRSPISNPRPSAAWVLHDQYIGVEIETEGLSGPTMGRFDASRQSWWTYHNDPSLRNNGIEFTLTNPYMGQDLLDAVDFLYSTIVIPAHQSGRTSTHLHLNMQQDQDTTDVLRGLVAIYYALEPAFYQLVAGDRQWSGYCHPLDARQAESLQSLFSEAGDVDMQEWYSHVHQLSRTGGGRYYGLNLAALLKYGTIEFRHFPCATSRSQLVSYINLVMELKAAAIMVASSPLGVMGFLTSNQDFGFLRAAMPTWGQRLLEAQPAGQASVRLGKLIANSSRTISRSFEREDHPVIEKYLEASSGKKIPAKKRATKVPVTRPTESNTDIFERLEAVSANISPQPAEAGERHGTAAHDIVRRWWDEQAAAGIPTQRSVNQPLGASQPYRSASTSDITTYETSSSSEREDNY